MTRPGDGASRLRVSDLSRHRSGPATSASTRATSISRTWTTSFSASPATRSGDLAVGVGDAAREMHIGVVSASFFGFFDAPPVLGRYFTAAEDSTARRRASRGAEPRDVADAVRRHDATCSAPRSRSGRSLHDHRRRAAGIRRTVGRSARRRHSSRSRAMRAGTRSRLKLKRSWWTTYSWGWMSMIARRKPGVSIASGERRSHAGVRRRATRRSSSSSRAVDADQPGATARDRRIDPRRARAERVERRQGRDVGRRRVGHRAAHRVRQRREPAARARAPTPARDRAAPRARRESRTTVVAAVHGERGPRAARRCGGRLDRALGRRGAARGAARQE